VNSIAMPDFTREDILEKIAAGENLGGVTLDMADLFDTKKEDLKPIERGCNDRVFLD
jgi:hypothetical protein